MKLKKPDSALLKHWLRLGAMIVLTVLSCYTLSPRRGILSTLPFVTLGCFVSALLGNEKKHLLLLSALCGFSFTLADGSGIPLSCLIGGFCALCALLAAWSAGLLHKGKSNKKPLLLIPAVTVLLLAPLGQMLLFSTPWENLRMQGVFREYVEKTYPDQSFEELRVAYHPAHREYQAIARFAGSGEVILEATLSHEKAEDGKDVIAKDEFFTRFCERGLEKRQGQFVSIVRSQYPDAKLWLDCSKTTLDPNTVSSLSGSYGQIPPWLTESTALEIGFQYSITNVSDFVKEAKAITALLKEQDFAFDRIRFLAGDQGTYRYVLTVRADTSPEDFASLVKPCKLSMNISSLSLEYSYLF